MSAFVRRYWVVLVLGLVVVAIFFALHRRAPQASAVAPAVQLVRARQGDLAVRVIAHGRVGPPPGSSAALAFQVPGRLENFFVHVGDRVEAGQPLAQLDSTPFELAVSQAGGDADAANGALQSTTSSVVVRNQEASAAAHQADLKVAADESALARVRALYSAGIAAAKEVQAAENQLSGDQADARTAHLREQALLAGVGGPSGQSSGGQARADVLAAKGQAERADASLALAQRQLANTTLRAPGPGIVVAILKHPGESVDSSTPVVTLGAVLEHAATLSVPAEGARRVHVGDRAELHVARSAQTYTGTVTATVAAVDPLTQQATVVVNGIPPSAFPGDAVEASIVVASVRGILVPTAAIVEDPQSGDTVVFVASSGNGVQQKFELRKVQIGASDQTTTQIISGLHVGELVAAEGAIELLAPAAPSGD